VFVTENRNKKSVTLNLKSEKGKEILLKLARESDIFVENFAPGLMEKLGLSYDALKRENPRIIYCSISGFGKDTSNRDRPAWDAALQAMSGLMTITGDPDRPPMRVGASIVDLTAAVYALSGILLALFEREKSGEGRFIDISLFDSALSLVNYWIAYSSITGRVPMRMGNEWPALAPYQVFKTKYETYLFIGASNDEYWRKLCEILGLGELVTDERFASNADRVKRMKELAAAIERKTEQLEQNLLLEKLVSAGIPCAPVNNIKSILSDPSLASRGTITETSYQDVGKFLAVNSPLISVTKTPESESPPPTLGQHTVEILHRMGFGDEQIDGLRKEKII
jgi:crotonobetainyl-CoA:carnitine CoA-transferase CaiB-like acyl-CoA transferase